MSQLSVEIPEDERTQATPTLYNRLVKDVTELYAGTDDVNFKGWIEYGAEGTRNDDHSFDTAADPTLFFRRGDKIRWKKGGAGSYLYGLVYRFDIVNNRVFLIPNTAYTIIAGDPLTDIAISRIVNPEIGADAGGFFAFASDVAAVTNPTISNVSVIHANFYPIASGGLSPLMLQADVKAEFEASGTAGNRIYAKLPAYFPSLSMREELMGHGFLTVGGVREVVHVFLFGIGADRQWVAIERLDKSNFSLAAGQIIEFTITYPVYRE
jgi:hypothetical protein